MKMTQGVIAGTSLALAWFIFDPRGESLEKKKVEFLMSARECKRVQKNVNTKGIARNEEHRLAGLKAEAPSPMFSKRYDSRGLSGWTSATI